MDWHNDFNFGIPDAKQVLEYLITLEKLFKQKKERDMGCEFLK